MESGIDKKLHWFNHIRITLWKKVGSTKSEIGLTTWSTKGWVGCWETIGCSGEGNSWVLDHTLHTFAIAGHWWVRWSPSHSLQGNLSLHFKRPVFSMVSTWLAVFDSFLSPIPLYHRGAKSVVQKLRISFSWKTYSFSTTYSTFDWFSGWIFPVFGSPNSSFGEWSLCDWTNSIFVQSHSPFIEWLH